MMDRTAYAESYQPGISSFVRKLHVTEIEWGSLPHKSGTTEEMLRLLTGDGAFYVYRECFRILCLQIRYGDCPK